jgi:hypothetical protein
MIIYSRALPQGDNKRDAQRKQELQYRTEASTTNMENEDKLKEILM